MAQSFGPSETELALHAAIDGIKPDLIETRRYLHAHPELSFAEVKTTQTLSERLTHYDISHRILKDGVGLIAELPKNPDLPWVAIRADIDALAIEEQNEVAYKSRNPGVMHACGHDAHMTCALGALEGLRLIHDRVPGNIRILFQPAEEVVPGGAIKVIAEGGIENLSAIYALHVAPEIPVGQIGIKPGAFTASSDRFDVIIHGRSGHGARPHQAVDPIFVGSQIISALYHGMRQFDPRDAAVVSVGRFQGGYSANVIPETAEFAGTLRAFNNDTRPDLKAMIRRTVNDIAHMHGATAEITISQGPPAIMNDAHATNLLAEVARDVVGGGSVLEIEKPSMGSEDFAEFLQEIPGAMFRLGVGSERCRFGLHNARFDLEEDALPIGAKMLASAVLRTLERLEAHPSPAESL